MNNDVKILLWKSIQGGIVSKSIRYFTQSEYTHAAVFIRGATYESTVWKEGKKWRRGIRKSFKQLPCQLVMLPDKPLPTDKVDDLQRVAESYHTTNKPYNILKLLSLAIVWPLRWFFKKLNWVPFNSKIFGEVCSGFVDEVFFRAGIDLFPLDYEGYTVPAQFTDIVGWHKEK